MMPSMTRNTKNFKVFNRVVMPIFIDMMNFKLATFFRTSIASMWKMFKSYFTIAGNSIFKSTVLFSRRPFSNLCIKPTDFTIHTSFRTMNSVGFIWPDKKIFLTFRAALLNLLSSVVFVKTRFTAKNITAIEPIKFKTCATFFADFRFSDFFTRSRIASFRAKYLPLVIPRDFLITSFAVHAIDRIRCLLTSQSHRRIYG